MALGTDMKSLVEDIQASREAREKALDDISKDTRHIIGDAKTMLKDFAKEGEERAHEVKSFLKSSGEARKQDFDATMKTVHASIEDVKKDSKHARNAGKTIIKDARSLLASISKDNKEQAKDLAENLKKGEHDRKTAFNGMMGDIQEDLKDMKHDSDKARKDAKDIVSRYHYSRMSAQKHWASLSAGRKKKK